jgi:hypothetical protein
MSQRVHDIAARAADLTPPEAAQVRTSRKRAEGLKQYIEGLLPSHLAAEVDVVITEKVSTAAVLPATEDALLDGDETDFDKEQAKQLVEQVDGDYLVLVTGREADTSSICISDQLTADTAHQFGLAFHETLHILKTSFGAVQTLVEDEVEEQYQDFVHELINIGEDGAIENEAQTGDDFTERAGNRLTLVRQIHSQTVEDLPNDKQEFSFGDALLKALHDEIIYPTGVTEALLDETDSRVTFSTNDEREAFIEVHAEIEALRDDLLALRSDHSDRLYEDDREASLQRAKRIIVFWHDVLKPIIENGQPPQQQGQQSHQQEQGQPQENQEGSGQSQNQPQPGGDSASSQQQSPGKDSADSEEGDQSGNNSESGDGDGDFDCPDCDDSFDTDHGRRVHYGQQHGDTDGLDDQLEDAGPAESESSEQTDSAPDAGTGSPDGEIDPEELSLDTDSYENPLQSVSSHPSISDEPDPDNVDLEPQPASGTPDTQDDNTQEPDNKGDGGAGSDGGDEPTSTEDTNDGETNSESGSESGTSSGTDRNESDEEDVSNGDRDSAPGEDSSGSDSAGGDTVGESGEQTPSDESAGESETERGESGAESEQNGPETATTPSSAASSELASHADQSESGSEGQQATFGDFANSDTGDTSEVGDESSEESHNTDEQAEDAADGDAPAESGDAPERSHEPDSDSTEGPNDRGQESGEDGVDFDSSETSNSQAPTESLSVTSDGESQSASTVDDTDTSSGDSSESAASETGRDSSQTESATQQGEDDNSHDAGRGDDESTDGPAHAEADLEPDDFAGDRQRADRAANESTIDEQGLEEDLRSLESALGNEEETAPDGDDGGGDGAGPSSVDELTILPDPEDNDQSEDWQEIEDSADTVADTLAKELRLDQQTNARNGLSSGTQVNTKTAYRLNHNDPRTFSETLPGDEKEYFVVFVLDRSSSMGPGYYANRSSGPAKIDVATSAVARFAVACENLDIDVAIIDFYDEEARYVKPPSVETEFAQKSILNSDNAGGTPLSDALSLARTVADADAKESLIITITDDKPAKVEDVEIQIKASYSPICSLTIATDCEFGNPPDKAERLEKTYDQTTTVYDPSKLEDRIDQLASLLGAY